MQEQEPPLFLVDAVANFFIDKARSLERNDLDQMKLQKLLYYAQGWSLGLTGRRLFGDRIEARARGPVVSAIDEEFGHYNDIAIERLAEEYTYEHDGNVKLFQPVVIDPAALKILEAVWRTYKNYSGSELSAMTHRSGSPWTIVAEGILRDKHDLFPPGFEIPVDLVEAHFKKLVEPTGSSRDTEESESGEHAQNTQVADG